MKSGAFGGLAAWIAAVLVSGALAVSPLPAAAQNQVGKSGLPLPRFVSLKSNKVNVRKGPGEDFGIAWIFVKSRLPVEVTQEYDNWRRIRDSDGQEGWVFQSLLSGERTAVVAPWEKGPPLPLRTEPAATAAISAYVGPGVLASVDRCHAGWCRISEARFRGWIQQDRLWGVYPNEELN